MEIVGVIFLTIGGIFMFLGVLGLIRMPDVFNKLQAGTKATTLGFLSLALGLFFIEPAWWGKILVIVFFVLFTNPVGSHNIARAVHKRKEKAILPQGDDLKEGVE